MAGCHTENDSTSNDLSEVEQSTLNESTTTSNDSGTTANSDLRQLSENTIALKIDEKKFMVQLYDNPTANDLLTQLPLTVTANDYAGYDEKVLRLSTALSMEKAPKGDNPLIPEVGYYHPGKWIALYYGPIGYWAGKVPIGKINASVEELAAIQDNTTVTMEVIRQ